MPALFALDRTGAIPYNPIPVFDGQQTQRACLEEVPMDPSRMIGIAIVMMVPAFVIGGAIWALVESWAAVGIIEIIIAGVYVSIVRGKWPARTART